MNKLNKVLLSIIIPIFLSNNLYSAEVENIKDGTKEFLKTDKVLFTGALGYNYIPLLKRNGDYGTRADELKNFRTSMDLHTLAPMQSFSKIDKGINGIFNSSLAYSTNGIQSDDIKGWFYESKGKDIDKVLMRKFLETINPSLDNVNGSTTTIDTGKIDILSVNKGRADGKRVQLSNIGNHYRYRLNIDSLISRGYKDSNGNLSFDAFNFGSGHGELEFKSNKMVLVKNSVIKTCSKVSNNKIDSNDGCYAKATFVLKDKNLKYLSFVCDDYCYISKPSQIFNTVNKSKVSYDTSIRLLKGQKELDRYLNEIWTYKPSSSVKTNRNITANEIADLRLQYSTNKKAREIWNKIFKSGLKPFQLQTFDFEARTYKTLVDIKLYNSSWNKLKVKHICPSGYYKKTFIIPEIYFNDIGTHRSSGNTQCYLGNGKIKGKEWRDYSKRENKTYCRFEPVCMKYKILETKSKKFVFNPNLKRDAQKWNFTDLAFNVKSKNFEGTYSTLKENPENKKCKYNLSHNKDFKFSTGNDIFNNSYNFSEDVNVKIPFYLKTNDIITDLAQKTKIDIKEQVRIDLQNVVNDIDKVLADLDNTMNVSNEPSETVFYYVNTDNVKDNLTTSKSINDLLESNLTDNTISYYDELLKDKTEIEYTRQIDVLTYKYDENFNTQPEDIILTNEIYIDTKAEEESEGIVNMIQYNFSDNISFSDLIESIRSISENEYSNVIDKSNIITKTTYEYVDIQGEAIIPFVKVSKVQEVTNEEFINEYAKYYLLNKTMFKYAGLKPNELINKSKETYFLSDKNNAVNDSLNTIDNVCSTFLNFDIDNQKVIQDRKKIYKNFIKEFDNVSVNKKQFLDSYKLNNLGFSDNGNGPMTKIMHIIPFSYKDPAKNLTEFYPYEYFDGRQNYLHPLLSKRFKITMYNKRKDRKYWKIISYGYKSGVWHQQSHITKAQVLNKYNKRKVDLFNSSKIYAQKREKEISLVVNKNNTCSNIFDFANKNSYTELQKVMEYEYNAGYCDSNNKPTSKAVIEYLTEFVNNTRYSTLFKDKNIAVSNIKTISDKNLVTQFRDVSLILNKKVSERNDFNKEWKYRIKRRTHKYTVLNIKDFAKEVKKPFTAQYYNFISQVFEEYEAQEFYKCFNELQANGEYEIRNNVFNLEALQTGKNISFVINSGCDNAKNKNSCEVEHFKKESKVVSHKKSNIKGKYNYNVVLNRNYKAKNSLTKTNDVISLCDNLIKPKIALKSGLLNTMKHINQLDFNNGKFVFKKYTKANGSPFNHLYGSPSRYQDTICRDEKFIVDVNENQEETDTVDFEIFGIKIWDFEIKTKKKANFKTGCVDSQKEVNTFEVDYNTLNIGLLSDKKETTILEFININSMINRLANTLEYSDTFKGKVLDLNTKKDISEKEQITQECLSFKSKNILKFSLTDIDKYTQEYADYKNLPTTNLNDLDLNFLEEESVTERDIDGTNIRIFPNANKGFAYKIDGKNYFVEDCMKINQKIEERISNENLSCEKNIELFNKVVASVSEESETGINNKEQQAGYDNSINSINDDLKNLLENDRLKGETYLTEDNKIKTKIKGTEKQSINKVLLKNNKSNNYKGRFTSDIIQTMNSDKSSINENRYKKVNANGSKSSDIYDPEANSGTYNLDNYVSNSSNSITTTNFSYMGNNGTMDKDVVKKARLGDNNIITKPVKLESCDKRCTDRKILRVKAETYFKDNKVYNDTIKLNNSLVKEMSASDYKLKDTDYNKKFDNYKRSGGTLYREEYKDTKEKVFKSMKSEEEINNMSSSERENYFNSISELRL